jgi:hypothetical protein
LKRQKKCGVQNVNSIFEYYTISLLVLVNNLNRKRPRGRPKQRWIDVVKRDIQELRPDWHGDLMHAYNREEWKNLILAAKGLNGL